MNKKTKFSILFASFAMAMGVGFVGGSSAKSVKAATATDVLTISNTNSGGNYGSWTTSDLSGAVYTGVSKNDAGAIYFNSTRGIVVSESAGNVKSITIEWDDGDNRNKNTSTLSLYLSDTALSLDTLYSGSVSKKLSYPNTEFDDIPSGTEYFGIGCTGTVYLKSVTIVWEDEREIESVSVASHPDTVYQGDTISGDKVELLVTYDDDTTNIVKADRVEVDTTKINNEVTATAYYFAEKEWSATFTVDVIERPHTFKDKLTIYNTNSATSYGSELWTLSSETSDDVTSSAIYTGSSRNVNDSISFASGRGIVVSKSAGYVKSITVEWYDDANNSINIYWSDDALSISDLSGKVNTADLAYPNDTMFDGFPEGTAYFGITSNGRAAYLTSITIEWEPAEDVVDPVEQFINDWHEMREAGGDNGICAFLTDSENPTLKALLDRFTEFSPEDQATIRGSIDIDTITIGQTMDYMASMKSWVNDSLGTSDFGLSSILLTSNSDNVGAIALVATLSLIVISGYYFMQKRKLAK